eukprot:g1929.t1
MGNEISSEYCGYRVLSVQENGPGFEAGLDPYFDFVVAANNVQLLSEDNAFLDIIAEHAGKELELIVYNSKRDETRMSTIIPRNNWGGQGLLGITIRFDSFENANENVIHILTVKPGSPADVAGIKPDDDYVLGTAEMVFHDMEELALCFEANINSTIPLYVYSASTDAVRVVNITPNTNWGGYGIFGCDVGHGYLHRLPTRKRSSSSSGSRISSTSNDDSENKKIVIGSTLKTSMGNGKLLFARYDGFKIVELEWRLAQNQKAIMYTKV